MLVIVRSVNIKLHLIGCLFHCVCVCQCQCGCLHTYTCTQVSMYAYACEGM